ncbi:MAG: ABC transporter ATP-binding protein/permease [Acidobacteriota bacterium]|nr:ABC transporter ATP-binding protein/permease [Acidobacteriota bacterium]
MSPEPGNKPKAAQPPEKKPKVKLDAVWREARQVVWEHRGRMAVGLGLLLVGRLAGLVLPASTKFLIDEVIGKSRTDLLFPIAAAAAVGTVVQAGSSFSLALLLGAAAQRSINDLRVKVQRHIGRLPISYFEEHKSGELISRIMNDAEGVRNLVGTGFVNLIGGAVTSVVAFAFLLWLNWRLTLVTMIFMTAFAVVMGVGFNHLRPLFRNRGKIQAEITGRLAESLGGSRVVKAYTAEERESEIFSAKAEKLLDNVVKSVIGVSAITTLGAMIFGLAGLTMGVLGTRGVLRNEMTVGDLFTFIIFTGVMVTPLIQMSSIATQFTEAFAGLDRIREVFSEATEDEGDEERRSVTRLSGEVVFEDVHFEYKPGTPVLHDVSFVAPAGSTTALVGSSGAGKSTIIGLILAFRRPGTGRVLVDGEDLANLKVREYRSQLAVVLQDDFLFDGTIDENISYSRPEATPEEIRRAAQLAHCDEFVGTFEDGYETIIGERGVKLSGGQRQRVTIARAILADPRILILDEATSSLDSESEQWIQEGLRTLKQGRTTFVIAHRLSTIRNADQILVIEEGRILERGSHQELLLQAGRYKELYEKQYRIESDLFVNPGEEPAEEATDVAPEIAARSDIPRNL